jgi:hypothetical protein
MKKPFSKKLLIIDYVVAVVLIMGYMVCVALNGLYEMQYISNILVNGYDSGYLTTVQLFNLDGFGVLLGIWIAQLGISSGAYYMLIKSEHKIQLPMQMINELPDDVKEQVDMNELITTVLTTTDN